MRYEFMRKLEMLLNELVIAGVDNDFYVNKCADAGEYYYPKRNENNWLGNKRNDHYGIYRIYNENFDYGIQFTDWRGQDDFYIIVFDNSQKNTASLEIKDLKGFKLIWRYKPCKRDGLNKIRKEIFAKNYPDCVVDFDFPNGIDEVIRLCKEIIEVAEARKKADMLEEE